jgi:hypothetical protein
MAGIVAEGDDRPLFRSTLRRTGRLTGNPLRARYEISVANPRQPQLS